MSHFNALAIYLGERYSLRVYVPLSFFLAMGLMVIEPGSRRGWFFVEGWLILLLLLFPFRLLDDLSSIEEDRQKDPGRVLCRVEDLRFFQMVLYIVFLLGFGLLLFMLGPLNGMGYGVLFGTIHLWYGVATGPRRQPFLPLIKYPLLVLIVSTAPVSTQRAWPSLVLILAAFAAYEILHDPVHEERISWLRGSFVRRNRVFRFLPFVGVAIWFGIVIFR